VWQRGLFETRESVVRLNGRVVAELAAVGIPAVGVSPFPWCKTTNRELGNSKDNVQFLRRLAELMETGFVPVLHGDAVLDYAKGCTILSGDTILKGISQELDLDYAVFLTDVDGVFDLPPEANPDAQLIRAIPVTKNGDFEIPQTDAAAYDCTGGIATKIKSAVQVAH
jgi:isopentenyl phosphate kinase